MIIRTRKFAKNLGELGTLGFFVLGIGEYEEPFRAFAFFHVILGVQRGSGPNVIFKCQICIEI